MSRFDELLAENAALRELLAGTIAENDKMARVTKAYDQLKAAMAEVARYPALCENAERSLAVRSQELNERARNVV